eukprot:gb/GEZN01004902.1/.p1 GENE.gb/GEZN01004902.1/~~gb/GEZN01004902.1/.p1  ORF type:complete len:521 (-),score=55.41 gb/GEZN01004902.1/:72-1634(-)
MLASSMSALAEAYYSHRVVVLIPSHLSYYPRLPGEEKVPQACRTQYECWFSNPSGCRLEHVTDAQLESAKTLRYNSSARFKLSEERRGNVAVFVPPPDSAARHDLENGPLWWSAELFRYVFRPREKLAEELKKQLQEFLAHHAAPFLGVHIREDTHRSEVKPHPTLQQYMSAVDSALSIGAELGLPLSFGNDQYRYEVMDEGFQPFSSVYLATEATTVESGFKHLYLRASRPPLIVFNRIRAEGVGDFRGDALAKGEDQASRAAVEGLLDMIKLGHCDRLVGTGSSHFLSMARLIQVLRGVLSPPILLDLDGILKGNFSVGMLHLANIAVAAVPTRWVLASNRWHEAPVPLQGQQFDLQYAQKECRTSGRATPQSKCVYFKRPQNHPAVSDADVFDQVVEAWRGRSDLVKQCPMKSVDRADKTRQSVAQLIVLAINTGVVLYQQLFREEQAQVCFTLAVHLWQAQSPSAQNMPTIGGGKQDGDVAKENLAVVLAESSKTYNLLFLLRDQLRQNGGRLLSF